MSRQERDAAIEIERLKKAWEIAENRLAEAQAALAQVGEWIAAVEVAKMPGVGDTQQEVLNIVMGALDGKKPAQALSREVVEQVRLMLEEIAMPYDEAPHYWRLWPGWHSYFKWAQNRARAALAKLGEEPQTGA